MGKPISLADMQQQIELRDVPVSDAGIYNVKKLYGNLALPSYVHGYSLAIEYMYDWFKSKFPKDFFRGGIYIDGKKLTDAVVGTINKSSKYNNGSTLRRY